MLCQALNPPTFDFLVRRSDCSPGFVWRLALHWAQRLEDSLARCRRRAQLSFCQRVARFLGASATLRRPAGNTSLPSKAIVGQASACRHPYRSCRAPSILAPGSHAGPIATEPDPPPRSGLSGWDRRAPGDEIRVVDLDRRRSRRRIILSRTQRQGLLDGWIRPGVLSDRSPLSNLPVHVPANDRPRFFPSRPYNRTSPA